jgi:hypothetical protein
VVRIEQRVIPVQAAGAGVGSPDGTLHLRTSKVSPRGAPLLWDLVILAVGGTLVAVRQSEESESLPDEEEESLSDAAAVSS